MHYYFQKHPNKLIYFLFQTLLHEMIHAYLFVTNNDKDREGHGPEFCKHMHRINRLTGANITVCELNNKYNIY